MFNASQGTSANIFIAEQEMELVTVLFNNMVDSCHKKCISPSYHEGEMNKGESVCADRCVAKYFAVTTMINTKFTAQQQQDMQK